MDLYLQFGYGMLQHSQSLAALWHGGSVILSPRDLSPDRIVRAATRLRKAGAAVAIDPQFYLPRADHQTLVRHDYWPDKFETDSFLQGAGLSDMMRELALLCEEAGCSFQIIPGLYGHAIDEDWVSVQERVMGEALAFLPVGPKLHTLCLSAEALRSEAQVQLLLESVASWPVDGFYVVPEHQGGQYLVDDPTWLANLLDLCAGLKLLHRRVVVGYCSHQCLCLAAANVDAIAAGSWLNVRLFSLSKFREASEVEQKRRAVWYYAPQVLSEFRPAFLDMAFRVGKLDLLRPPPAFASPFAEVLFAGAQPSSVVAFRETEAHRHYLHCLCQQAMHARRATYRETLDAQFAMLSSAEALLREVRSYGVRGQHRDFEGIFDVNRSALEAFDRGRGFVLERQWL
jgi:hypothetical protein